MNKNKRRLFVLLICAVIGAIFLIKALKFDSYTINYKIDDYTIEEGYDEESGFYSFKTAIKNREYTLMIKNDSINKKKLIKDVSFLENEEERCILLESSKFETYPVCYQGEDLVDYNLIQNKDDDFYKNREIEKTNIEYSGIEVKNQDRSYFIWDYRGYYLINKTERRKIEFLEGEYYQNSLAYRCGQYLLTVNYDQEYNFTEIYILDMKNGKIDKWELDEEFSYNSYFLGDVEGEVYIVDCKNKKEFKLNPRKKRIERVDKDGVGLTYEYGWEKVSMSKLANDTYTFKKDDQIDYFLDDGTLKSKYPNSKDETTLSSKKVDKIIYSEGDTVYYLVKDEIYSFSSIYGENLILKYSELNFNNKNYVFLY